MRRGGEWTKTELHPENACYLGYGAHHCTLNQPERDGRDMVDGLEREGARDVSASQAVARRVAAAENCLAGGADELSQTRVKPG